MTTKKSKDIETALVKKGFEKQDSHHKLFWFKYKGKITSIRTRLSHGIDEYGDSLLGMMARQLNITKKQLNDLIDCPLTKEQYEKTLQDQGKIEKDDARNDKQSDRESSPHKKKK